MPYNGEGNYSQFIWGIAMKMCENPVMIGIDPDGYKIWVCECCPFGISVMVEEE